jgi:hypothetical protein
MFPELLRAGALAAMLAAVSVGVAHADDAVGLWVKNTSPVPVTVSVDGTQACVLEAPVFGECAPHASKKTQDKITKLTEKKTCTINNLKISCITNVPAAGADVSLRRSDGIEYKLRAAKGGTLYLCVEPAALTDCFGKKIQ